MNKKFTLTQGRSSLRMHPRYSKLGLLIFSSLIMLATLIAGCKKDDFEGEVVDSIHRSYQLSAPGSQRPTASSGMNCVPAYGISMTARRMSQA